MLPEYVEAHKNDYTNEQINAAIANAGHASASDLATHTGNADIHVTTDDKAKWNAAEKNAKDAAAAALATARTEISAEIDADVLVETNRAKGVEEGLQAAINTINNADNGILAQAKSDATTKANTAESNAKSYVDVDALCMVVRTRLFDSSTTPALIFVSIHVLTWILPEPLDRWGTSMVVSTMVTVEDFGSV